MEHGSTVGFRFDPQVSRMALYDGATDRQPQPHALYLGGKKGFEDARCQFSFKTWPGVFDGHPDLPLLKQAAKDSQFLGAGGYILHGLDSVDHQIQQHLFNLDTIAINLRNLICDLYHQGRTMLTGLWLEKRNSLLNQRLEINQGVGTGLLRAKSRI